MNPLLVGPATKVDVFQCPWGAEPTARALFRGTGVEPRQLGRGAHLVQEHPTPWVKVALPNPPTAALENDVGAILLGSPQRLFLSVQPISFTSEWMVAMAAWMPC